MSKFVTGKDLEDVVYNIIWDAQKIILVVSPYIKLDDYFKKLFNKHVHNPKLHLLLLFGKNEKDIKRSFSKSDFDYFQDFPNVSIVYSPSLHAKYYGNENKGVITSINLYDYSFINNIEFGVYSETSLLGNFANSPDKDAWETCMDIANESEVVFVKRPVYEKKLLSKNFVHSRVILDETEKFYKSFKKKEASKKKLFDFPEELFIGSTNEERPEREVEVESKVKVETKKTIKKNIKKNDIGYCIRCNEGINLNPKAPYCKDCYRVWARFEDALFPEKYCHYCGEKEKTNMEKPVCYSCFKKTVVGN